MAWTVLDSAPTGSCRFLLFNGTYLPVYMTARCRYDFRDLAKSMEEHHVPISYTHGLKEISFTTIQEAANIAEGKIQIACGRDHWWQIPSAFVHELGHHMDDREKISSRPEIIAEFKESKKSMPDPYARKNLGEYVAVGFEIYYFGPPEDLFVLREKNRVLFDVVEAVHLRNSAS